MATEFPHNAPKTTPEELSQKPTLESLDQEVQTEAYREMIKSIDERYPVDLGNVLKRYVKTEFVQKGKPALMSCKKTVDEFNALWDTLPQVAEKLGVRASTKPDRLLESLAGNGIFNPEQTALVQLLAIKNGINATLRGEYVAYMGQLKVPDILAKYHELTH